MSDSRLKPRFTEAELHRIESLAHRLGLTPAQVVKRLLLRELSPVPLANRQLWQACARTSVALDAIAAHLGAQPTDLLALVDALRDALTAYRQALLGLGPNGEQTERDP